jgi:hypothetical protein
VKLAHLSHDLLAAGQCLVGECATPILCDEDQLGVNVMQQKRFYRAPLLDRCG